jgi:hypothetical protein
MLHWHRLPAYNKILPVYNSSNADASLRIAPQALLGISS